MRRKDCGEDRNGQYAKECGIESAGLTSCCNANSNRRLQFGNQESTLEEELLLPSSSFQGNQESTLEEELLLHVSCYVYEVSILWKRYS